MLGGLNRMIDDIADGRQVFYDIYSDQEKLANRSKENTGLFFFRGKPEAPFAIVSPGGGFAYVGSVHEGFPYAVEINREGFNVFVLKYRVGQGGRIATEEMLLERGIVVSYETIRRWGRKFGPAYAKQLRRKKPSHRDIWHLDEVVISIAGRTHWLWRAVDQDGYVLDEIVQNRRNTKAAKRLLIRLLRKQGLAPRRIITDKLRSYGAAKREVMPDVEHWSRKGLNNRAEDSHLPIRKRERMMQGFRAAGGLQRFVSVFSAFRNLFVPPHQKRSALSIHIHRLRAMEQWKAMTGMLA